MPRGLDPVLIAGTDGEFDPWIQFVNMPLELVMEQWWVERKQEVTLFPPPSHPEVRAHGSPETWGELCPITPLEHAVVATETAHPEWVALTHLIPQRQQATRGLSFSQARRAVNSQPMSIEIMYDFRSEDSYLIGLEIKDCRYSYVNTLRGISRQRFLGSFDFDEEGFRLDCEVGLKYEGRGWKMFNHEHLHAITGSLGINLRDPDFLTGTCAFMEETLR